MGNTYHCSFSLPQGLATDISFIAKRMGISQSALLAQLLEEPITDLRGLMEKVPPQPTESDVRRLRGDSIAVIEKRFRDVHRKLGDA